MEGTVKRAFELARSGTCRTVTDIGLQLKREGFSGIEDHLEGKTIRKQLITLMKAAHRPA